MVVLGIDPGSLNTGYGVVSMDRNGFRMLACGVIRLHRRKSHADRIGEIYRDLESVIGEHNPSRAALETVFLSRNVQSALKLGQVRGAVIALCVNRGLELSEYAPREVKEAITGRGGASKQQVDFMVRSILRMEEKPETYDVTDALGIALCDLLKTSAGKVALPGSGRAGGSGKKRGWSQFVESRPDMIVR